MERRTTEYFPQPEENLHHCGKRSAREISYLIGRAKEVLCEEKKVGEGKLSGTIDDIANGPYGGQRFRAGPTVHLPAEGVAIFVGDIHADIESLGRIVDGSGFYSRVLRGESVHLVCLGDLVNRGTNSAGVMEYIMMLKCLLPESVDILKGNHEEMVCDTLENYSTNTNWLSGSLISSYGYKEGLSLYREYQDLFAVLPKMLITGNGLVAVHGGTPHKKIEDLVDLQQNEELLRELLWNHAQDDEYDPDIITILAPEVLRERRNSLEERHQFLNAIGAHELIAGHVVYKDGFKRHECATNIISTGKGSPETYVPNVTPWYLETPLDIHAKEIDLASYLHPVYLD